MGPGFPRAYHPRYKSLQFLSAPTQLQYIKGLEPPVMAGCARLPGRNRQEGLYST